MVWLVILGLVVWLIAQERRIGRLEKAARAQPAPLPQPVVSRLAPDAADISPPVVEPSAPPKEAPQPEPEPEVAEPIAARETPQTVFIPPPHAPAPPEPRLAPQRLAPPRPETPRVSFSAWLAENGLAWLGGGGLLLGGLFLVVYGAQAGWFTPVRQIAAAILAGAAMIGASEWLRRRPDQPALAAALAAGAGASTLYGAVWAAHGIYHLIGPEAAVAGVALVSLGLLALALRHGQPLAYLALAGAFAAPLVAGTARWEPLAPTAYVLAVGAAGFALSAARRWGGAGIATLAGLGLWAVVARAASLIQHDSPAYAAVLILAAPVGAVATGLWRQRRDPAAVSDAFSALATLGITLASVLSVGGWSGPIGLGAAIVGAVAVLAAFAAWRGLAHAGVYLAPIIAACLGAGLAFLIPVRPPSGVADQAAVFALAAILAGGGLVAGLRLVSARALLIGAGAIGAAVFLNLVWLGLSRAGASLDFALPAAGAAAMAAAALLLARRSPDAASDRALGLWLAGSAELLFLSLHAAFVPEWAPAAHAAAALALAVLARRLGWRGLAQTAVAGGLITLAAFLRPAVVSEAFDGRLPWPQLAALTAIASVLLLAGGRVLIARSRLNAEALASAALMVALMGAFLVLHALLAVPGGRLGALMESSLRTALLLAAALLLAWRATPDDGLIARWRMYAVLAVGVLHGLFLQGLVFNPLGGLDPTPLGPPLANTLAVAYLTPALMLGALARRGVPGPPFWRRACAAAAFVFALAWALLEVRHAFHGEAMTQAGLTRPEAACDAVILLLAAWGLAELRRRRDAAERLMAASWLTALARPFAWAALGLAALTLWLVASPWWGWDRAPLASPVEAALLFAAYAAAVAATVLLARAARLAMWTDVARAAAVAVVVDLLVLAALAIRLIFHRLDLASPEPGRVEALCLALMLLIAGWGLTNLRRRPGPVATQVDPTWLFAAAQPFAAGAIGVAAWAMAWWTNPWWGPYAAPLVSFIDGAALMGLYALAIAMTALIAREAALSRSPPLRRIAAAAVVIDLFVLITLLIRWAFRGDDMHAAVLEASVETWTYSAVWAGYGLGVLVLGARRRDVTLRWLGLIVLIAVAAKVVLFDTARLAGFIRAFSFMFVGALLLAGAVIARRLNAASPDEPEPAAADSAPPNAASGDGGPT